MGKMPSVPSSLRSAQNIGFFRALAPRHGGQGRKGGGRGREEGMEKQNGVHKFCLTAKHIRNERSNTRQMLVSTSRARG